MANNNDLYDKKNSATEPYSELLDVIQKLSLAKDLSSIMLIVRKAARKLTGADGVTFVLKEGEHCYYADEDAIAPLWKGKRFPMNICVSGWVMENRQAVIIEDIYSNPLVPADAYRPTFVKSLAIVPIRASSPVGAIGAYWSKQHYASDEQINLLKALADSTSVALENIQSQSTLDKSFKKSAQLEITRKLMEANLSLASTFKELRKLNNEITDLKTLSGRLQMVMSLEGAYKLISEFIRKTLPSTAGTLYLLNTPYHYFIPVLDWNDPISSDSTVKTEDCLALHNKSFFKSDLVYSTKQCHHHKDNNRPYICIPLIIQNEITGLLYCEWKNDEANEIIDLNKKENQEIFLSMVAEQISISIANIKLRETLRILSTRDPLTGLFSRGYLEGALEKMLLNPKRPDTQVVILMLQILSRFDKNNYEAMEMLLQAFGKVLLNCARKEDIVSRFSEETFALVMPNMSIDDALKFSNFLQDATRQIHISYDGKVINEMEVAIGIALHPENGSNVHDIFFAAEAALTSAAKNENKTEIYKLT